MALINSWSVINSPQAASADLDINGGVINVTTVNNRFPAVVYDNITHLGAGVVTYQAEVLQITGVTFSASNNVTYVLSISQQIDGEVRSRRFFHTASSNASVGEIASSFVTQINTSDLHITASGAGSPITLTAQAGYPIFVVTLNTAFTSQSTSQAGKFGAYTGAQLIAMGVTDAAVGTNYHYWKFTFANPLPSNNTMAKAEEIGHTLYIADSSNGYGDTLRATLNNALKGASASTLFPNRTNSVIVS
jgi:hypothetical protein